MFIIYYMHEMVMSEVFGGNIAYYNVCVIATIDCIKTNLVRQLCAA